jgi:hypothetical protein
MIFHYELVIFNLKGSKLIKIRNLSYILENLPGSKKKKERKKERKEIYLKYRCFKINLILGILN